MTIGERIRKLRRDQRLTQIQLAEKAGIAVNSLRQYESGKSTPRPRQLELLADALGVPPADITDTATPQESTYVNDDTLPEPIDNMPRIVDGRFYPIGSGKAIFVMTYEDGTVYAHSNFIMPQPDTVTWHLSDEDAKDVIKLIQCNGGAIFSPEMGAGIKLILNKMAAKSKQLFEVNTSENNKNSPPTE